MEKLHTADPQRIGAYELTGRLGAGGMGVVYLGRSPGGRAVAVKVVKEHFAADAEYRARFRREVAAARRVTGTFTAPVLDADPDPEAGKGAPWLVTAYLPGLSLREAVAAFGALPPAALRMLAGGLAEALADIHRAGIAHRDLKPGNIMLTTGGPRVIDFGIARPQDATVITRVTSIIGTPGFMAPEQLSGRAAGPAGDIFSLGAVLLYAATGRRPFGTADTTTTRRDSGIEQANLGGIRDSGLHAFVTACLCQEPDQRPTATDLLDLLHASDESDESDVTEARASVREAAPSAAGWLPAALAEAIDRSAVEARDLPGLPARAAPGGQRITIPPVDVSLAAAETVVPAEDGRQDVQPQAGQQDGRQQAGEQQDERPNRRKLLAGGAAVLATLGGLKALSLIPGRDGSPTDGAPPNPETSPSRTPRPKASRTPPPTATRLWRKRVTNFFPDLAAAGDVLVASTNDDISGLAPRTGKTLWKHAIAIGPAVAGDVVYVVDADGGWPVSALRAATGATLWTYPVAFGEVGNALVHTGSVVCFGIETVRALGASDGQSRWTSKASPEHGLAAGDGILTARGDTVLTALDVADGRTRWTYRTRWTDHTPGRSTPYIADGRVLVFDEDGALHALDAKTGALIWKRPLVTGPYQLQAHGGVLYLSGASILAVRAATGETLWSQRLGGDEGAPYGEWNSLGLTGDTLYVGCTNKTVYALDAAGGHVLWSSPADMTHSSGPVAVDGVVCVGLKDGYVEALAPPTPNGGPSAGT